MITCSAAMRAEVAELFEVDPAGITVAHNGITPREWHVAPGARGGARRRRAPRGEPLLFSFGRLEYEKGVQDLIAALPRIRRAHPGTRLAVAGTGTAAPMLVEAARAHRVRRSVTFLGHLPDDELAATLAAADAVVLPSRYEPFGIVALEAAAAGAPLVASTAGGLGEVVVDGETGRVVRAGRRAGARRGGRPGARRPARGGAPGARGRARAAGRRTSTGPRIAEETAAVYAAAPCGGPRGAGPPQDPDGQRVRPPRDRRELDIAAPGGVAGASPLAAMQATLRRPSITSAAASGYSSARRWTRSMRSSAMAVFTAAVYSSSSACKRRTVSSVMGELLSG